MLCGCVGEGGGCWCTVGVGLCVCVCVVQQSVKGERVVEFESGNDLNYKFRLRVSCEVSIINIINIITPAACLLVFPVLTVV